MSQFPLLKDPQTEMVNSNASRDCYLVASCGPSIALITYDSLDGADDIGCVLVHILQWASWR